MSHWSDSLPVTLAAPVTFLEDHERRSLLDIRDRFRARISDMLDESQHQQDTEDLSFLLTLTDKLLIEREKHHGHI